jgi:glycine cleavage system aminomethyltransferase T
VSLEFLVPAADGPAVARSPMERAALAAGARMEVRDGWRVAASFGPLERERDALASSAGWTDRSHLPKFEVQAGEHELEALAGARLQRGLAARADGAWWCPITGERALAIADSSAGPQLRDRLARERLPFVETTTAYAALCVAGPLARETIARFCALDLRDGATPVHGFRPGSVARTPGYVLREDVDRFLLLFGWAFGEYLWTAVADAATALGGIPVGVDAVRVEAAVGA